MEKELTTKANAHNAARDKLRLQKKEAMKNKNAVVAKQRAKEQELASAKQDHQYAEQQIAAVRARGDDKASIDKQMQEWREAHNRATEMVQASQQAAHQQRKHHDDLEVHSFQTRMLQRCWGLAELYSSAQCFCFAVRFSWHTPERFCSSVENRRPSFSRS